ncbi:MAG: hypothetical protein R2724_13220 [Bryobacterales bacterium]
MLPPGDDRRRVGGLRVEKHPVTRRSALHTPDGDLNLIQNGRYRVEYDSKAQVPLMGGFSWTVGLFDRFDSDPPRDNVLRNDYGMVSTFGFSF